MSFKKGKPRFVYYIQSSRDPHFMYIGETTSPLKQKLFQFTPRKDFSSKIMEWKEREKEYLEIHQVGEFTDWRESIPAQSHFLDSLESDVIVFSGTSNVFQHKKTLEERAQEKQDILEWNKNLEERGRINRLRLEQGLPYLDISSMLG